MVGSCSIYLFPCFLSFFSSFFSFSLSLFFHLSFFSFLSSFLSFLFFFLHFSFPSLPSSSLPFPFVSFPLFIHLKVKRGRDRSCHWLSRQLQWPWAQGRPRSFMQIFNVGCRSSDTWTVLHCFSQTNRAELDCNLSSQDMKMCLYGMLAIQTAELLITQ